MQPQHVQHNVFTHALNHVWPYGFEYRYVRRVLGVFSNMINTGTNGYGKFQVGQAGQPPSRWSPDNGNINIRRCRYLIVRKHGVLWQQCVQMLNPPVHSFCVREIQGNIH